MIWGSCSKSAALMALSDISLLEIAAKVDLVAAIVRT